MIRPPGSFLDCSQRFHENQWPMRPPRWATRILVLLQLTLVLPRMTSGSTCIPADGVGVESGFCDCMMPVRSAAETAITMVGSSDCGPCRDVAFSALRIARPPAPDLHALAAPAGEPVGIAGAPPVPGAQSFWRGEPPRQRLPILRC